MPAKYKKKWKNINLMNFLNDEILIFGGYKMRYIYDKYSEAEENDLLASEYFRPDFPFYSCGISAGLQNNLLNHKIIYQTENEKSYYVYNSEELVWKVVSRKVFEKFKSDMHGNMNEKIYCKENGTPICNPIWIVNTKKFQREDKSGKHFYNISFITNESATNSLNTWVVIEQSELHNRFLYNKIKEGIAKTGKEELCSDFFRSEICRLATKNIEIVIPSCAGWYYDSRYGYVFLSRYSYKEINDENIPPLMKRRFVGETEREINDCLKDISPFLINWQMECLFGFRIVSLLLFLFKKYDLESKQILVPLVSIDQQCDVIKTILKTNDFTNMNASSLSSYIGDITNEIRSSNDGIAVLLGPQTAAESKLNQKQSILLRNQVLHANGVDSTTRLLIALVSKYMPQHIAPEYLFPIDCKEIPIFENSKKIRNVILEFEAAFVKYLGENIEKVEKIIKTVIEKYKESPDIEISSECKNIYIMFLALKSIMNDCFGFEIFNREVFLKIRELFLERQNAIISPDETVKDEFLEVFSRMVQDGNFRFMDKNKANKNFVEETNTIIWDSKKELLSFEMCSFDKIASLMNSVKDGSELSSALKLCGVLACTDNGGRQITIPSKDESNLRKAFYSVRLSALNEDIVKYIKNCGGDEFFLCPENVPENFVPIIWNNGKCAGIVLDGEGLSNLHCNISGNSGTGKNRGAFRTAECFNSLRCNVIFIDVKGACSESQLIEHNCNRDKYLLLDLKNDGLPFDIFDLSSYTDKSSKINYVMNVIMAAVPTLTENRRDELANYVGEIINENTKVFSLDDLFDQFPSNRKTALEKKLTSLRNLLHLYTPKNNEYMFSSCEEFLKDYEKIKVISLVQANETTLKCVVYSLMQALYEHQVLDCGIPLMLYADEMQRYDEKSPFKSWVSEGRQYKVGVTGLTQEYLSPDNKVKKLMSNAGVFVYYAPAGDASGKKVFEALSKRYSLEELQSMEVGSCIIKGFLWSKTERKHKFAILKGKNDNT